VINMFRDLKKVIEKSVAPIESIVKGEREPKTRSELGYAGWDYYFICDICGREYGPKSSVRPIHKIIHTIGGGLEILQPYYMRCPECGRFVCKSQCWNYNQGKCLSCAPSKEIAMGRMVPKVRSEHKITMWHYHFICDICDKEYGPEKSMSEQPDGGVKLSQKHYRQCPDCGKFVCRSQCWNYEKGTCTLCNALTLPEYIVTQEKLKTNYYLICSICRKQLGPISDVDWTKVKSIAMGSAKIALGSVTGGALAIGGATDIALAAKGGTHRKRMAKEVAAEAKTDLAQCPICSRWVCIGDCWDKDKGVCKACSTGQPPTQLEQPTQLYK